MAEKTTPRIKLLKDSKAIDLINFMEHKIHTVDKTLKKRPTLRVIIPADYQFYYRESGTFKPYDKKTNSTFNKYVYSNRRTFDIIINKSKYRINLDLVNFTGTQTNTLTNKKRPIEIRFKNETNLGKGLARNQWITAFGNDKRYNEFISILDERIEELFIKYASQSIPGTTIPKIIFGTLDNTLNDSNILQLWGANIKNYDSIASRGISIIGNGQAGYLKTHTLSTFGIVTTPSGGTPTLRDMGKRLYYRNTGKLGTDTTSASVESSVTKKDIITEEFIFRPCDKTKEDALVKRTHNEFISNLIRGNEASMGNAIKELTNGKKEAHWVWAIFPQPLNVYDEIDRYPTKKSITYGFNSYQEVEAFLNTNLLVENYIHCLILLLKAMEKKSLEYILSIDKFKVISSVKYLNFAIEKTGLISAQVSHLKENIDIFLSMISTDTVKVLGKKKSKKKNVIKKRSKNKKKSKN